MSRGYEPLVAGATMPVAPGAPEPVHGLYGLVPVAPSRRIIEPTPGALATAGVGVSGKMVASFLSVLAVRSRGAEAFTSVPITVNS